MEESDGDTDILTRFDRSDGSPSMEIVRAIGAFENVESAELPSKRGIALYEYVDPDALDRLCTKGRDVSVTVDVEDYRVHIRGEEIVVNRRSMR